MLLFYFSFFIVVVVVFLGGLRSRGCPLKWNLPDRKIIRKVWQRTRSAGGRPISIGKFAVTETWPHIQSGCSGPERHVAGNKVFEPNKQVIQSLERVLNQNTVFDVLSAECAQKMSTNFRLFY